jgi:2-oxoglutarate dehydrogenase E1 component
MMPHASKKDADTLVFCSGKIYYDILEQKEKNNIGENLAIIRLEQLYPLPEKQIAQLISLYNKKAKLVWAQEEPENMGAWSYIMRVMRNLNFDVVSLPASASPATGSPKVHEKRVQELMNKLFSGASVKA